MYISCRRVDVFKKMLNKNSWLSKNLKNSDYATLLGIEGENLCGERIFN